MWSSRDVRAAILAGAPVPVEETAPETFAARVVSPDEAAAMLDRPGREGDASLRALLTAHALFVQAVVTRYGIPDDLARFASYAGRSSDPGWRWLERMEGAEFTFGLRLGEDNAYRPLPRGMWLTVRALSAAPPTARYAPFRIAFELYDAGRVRSSLTDPRDEETVRRWLNRAVRGRRCGSSARYSQGVSAAA